MNAQCVVCTRPSGDVALCARCESKLTRAVAEIPALADELETTITRQTSSGPPQDYKKAKKELERPSPVNWTASEAADNLKATLVGWVRDIQPDPAQHPANDLTAIGRWFFARMDIIRAHKAVDDIHDQIIYAVREAWRAVDRPANRSRILVSACLDVACDGELYCLVPADDYDSKDPKTHARIVCSECETTYPAEQWMGLGRRVLAARRVA